MLHAVLDDNNMCIFWILFEKDLNSRNMTYSQTIRGKMGNISVFPAQWLVHVTEKTFSAPVIIIYINTTRLPLTNIGKKL